MDKAAKEVYGQGRHFVSRRVQISLLTVILAVIFTASIWSAAQLRTVLNDTTKEYLHDVTAQMTSDIRYTMEHKMEDLEIISDSVSEIIDAGEESGIGEFLKRKAGILEFSFMMMIDSRGRSVFEVGEAGMGKPAMEEMEGLADTEAVQASFKGKVSASYMGGSNIIYTAPVRVRGEVIGVLAGGRSKENMQKMIDSKSFCGNALGCITDSSGQVVIAPTELDSFMELDNIFRNETGTDTSSGIHKIQEDMTEGRDGTLRFTVGTQEELYLAYNSLGVNDWVLLTIIPADIISGRADQYILQSFIIVGITILVFSLFLFAVYRFYNEHRRQLEKIAFTDPVTGGANNAAFQMQYRELSKSMEPFTYAVVLLNVKGFKLINERFGINAGNGFLSYIYQNAERHMDTGRGEFAARVESDHFFLCINEHEPELIQSRLDSLIRDINSFRDTQLPCCQLSFRQGACIVEEPEMEITLLQDRARLAYQSQDPDVQQKCGFYDNGLTEKLKKELELSELFESSLKNHDFQVYLQPKTELKSGKAAGAEALVRWLHPERGMILPGDFIPLFEKNGKICELDLYVFKEVCKLLKRWIHEGRKLLPVSVNLSRQHFRTAETLKRFYDIAKEYGIPQGIIEFELTESIFFDNKQIKIVQESIRKMHQYGFLCSLDDFGSGFSSLGLLKEFDVDTIKLDRSFFINTSGTKAKEVIRCLIELAQSLDVQTVAEGIEKPEQLDYLRAVGCEMVQGYIYSRPLPIPEFEEFIEKM